MFDELEMEVMRLGGAGYCCSQIMLLLGLEELGRENPDLVRSMSGLCHGMGDCSGTCGVLTGGACLLALHTGKGTEDEERHDKLTLMLSEYGDWFRDLAQGEFGGFTCAAIVDGECGKPNPDRCPSLVARGYARVRELLAENGLDPAEGREA